MELTARGWTASTYELTTVRLMTWIGDHIGAGFAAFIDETGASLGDVEAIARSLDDRGWVNCAITMGDARDWAGIPLGPCQEYLARIADRVQDTRSRRIACRDALLDWLDDEIARGAISPPPDLFSGTVRAHYFGDPFTQNEIARAAKELSDRGLVRGEKRADDTFYTFEMTSRGQQVVEHYDSSISDFESESSRLSSQTNTVNIGGNNYGQAGAGNVVQDQTVGVDPATFAALVGDLRSAMSDLSESDRARAETYVEMIEGEVAGDEPNSRVLEVASTGLKTVGDRITNKFFDAGVDALWAYVASRLGLPGQAGS